MAIQPPALRRPVVHVRRLEDLRSTDTDFAGADAAERVRRLVAAAEQRVLLRAAAP